MSKKVSNKDYATALYQATHGLSGLDLSKVITNFVALLAKKQQLKKSANIIAEFVKYAKQQEGIVNIQITSARPLDEKTTTAINGAFGKQVETSVNVQNDLLGGFLVKTDDKIFDASLKTQLHCLKQALS